MYCPECKKEYDVGKFCPYCGAKMLLPEENTANQPAETDTDKAGLPGKDSDVKDENIQSQTEPLKKDEPENKKDEKAKKKSGKKAICITAVILAVVIAAAAFIYFNYFALTDSEKRAADAVENSIEMLPDKITIDHEDTIMLIEEKYEDLNDSQRSRVKNYSRLQAAIETIYGIRVTEVENAIKAIGDVTSESGEAIKNAQDLYKALPDEIKDRVKNYNVLEDSVEALNEIKVTDVENAIKAIGEVTAESGDTIQSAQDLYDALTDDLKEKVTSKEILDNTWSDYYKARADVVIKLIDSLGEITLDSGSKLDEIEEEYDQLPDESKELVTNYSDYENAESEYSELVEADNEKKRIAGIKNTISITKFSISEPNSAGGVSVYINFKNKSSKTIKYVVYTVTPYNAVGDQVYSEIGDKSTLTLKYTGPVASGDSSEPWYWDCIWYNSTIASAKMSKVEITYMDGTTETIYAEDIQYIKNW